MLYPHGKGMRALLIVLGLALAYSAIAEEPAPPVVKRLVSFEAVALPGLGEASTLLIPAIFNVPAGHTGKLPAVVILHGSAGLDSRGGLHGRDLNRAGIATLELDMWGARGLSGGAAGRPKRVQDTLPDLAGALAFLSHQTNIDATRIGAIGFSWGGVQAMLAATAPVSAELERQTGVRLGGLAAFYPVCWGYNHVPGYEFKALGPVRLLVLAGANDQYDDDPNACQTLVSGLPAADRAKVRVQVFAGSQHGFDMLEPAQRYQDPFLHRGKGGEGLSAPAPVAREASRRAVVGLFAELFGLDGSLAAQ